MGGTSARRHREPRPVVPRSQACDDWPRESRRFKGKGAFVRDEPYLFANDPDDYDIEIWFERRTLVEHTAEAMVYLIWEIAIGILAGFLAGQIMRGKGYRHRRCGDADLARSSSVIRCPGRPQCRRRNSWIGSQRGQRGRL